MKINTGHISIDGVGMKFSDLWGRRVLDSQVTPEMIDQICDDLKVELLSHYNLKPLGPTIKPAEIPYAETRQIMRKFQFGVFEPEDYPEDQEPKGKGIYYMRCHCSREFQGYKGRRECNLCASKNSGLTLDSNPMYPGEKQDA